MIKLKYVQNSRIQSTFRYLQKKEFEEIVAKSIQITDSSLLRGTIQGRIESKVLNRSALLQSTKPDQLWKFEESEEIVLREPSNVNQIPDSILKTTGTHYISGPFVCELNNVEIVGELAVPIYDGKYVMESNGGSLNSLTYSLILHHLTNCSRSLTNASSIHDTDSIQELDAAVPLLNPWSENYFHWTIDCLPRLRGVKHYINTTGQQPKLLVDSDPPKWMVESLQMLGISIDDIMEWDNYNFKVDSLIIPSLPYEPWFSPHSGHSRVYSRSGLQWLKDSLLEQVSTRKINNSSKKIYISRSDASSRRIINEREIFNLLSEYGFEFLTLTEMSLREQITTFCQADIIVAPHGAGLTNSIYSNDASVIELLTEKSPPCYYILNEELGNDYICVLCETVGEDIIVDIQTLNSALTDVLDESGDTG